MKTAGPVPRVAYPVSGPYKTKALAANKVSTNIQKPSYQDYFNFVTSCPVTFRDKRKLRFFENRVWRKIFKPKRDEITEEWRRTHDEKLYAM